MSKTIHSRVVDLWNLLLLFANNGSHRGSVFDNARFLRVRSVQQIGEQRPFCEVLNLVLILRAKAARRSEIARFPTP